MASPGRQWEIKATESHWKLHISPTELYLWSHLVLFFSVETEKGGVVPKMLISMPTSPHMHWALRLRDSDLIVPAKHLEASGFGCFLILLMFNKEHFPEERCCSSYFGKSLKTFMQRFLFQWLNSLPRLSDRPPFSQFYLLCFSCFIFALGLD